MIRKAALFLAFGIMGGYSLDTVSVDLLDKTRRKGVYDGFEITDSKKKIKIPGTKSDWAFSVSDFENNKFAKLASQLGEPGFQKIIKVQGYKIPKTEFETFRGLDKLPVYYFTRPDKQKGAVTLILVSYGEYQPSRYILHVEGIWRVKGLKGLN